ncbi:MAG: alpha/beta hydrolase [Bacteroidales bacterium]|nr:alpha/beta hydrolase [Bacteroidales bacterium]
MKSIFLTLIAVFFSLQWASAQYKRVDNISYSSSSDAYAQERCKLDVYYPENVKDAPVVVWFHGGGLEGGNKYIPSELENAGLVVVTVNYRLLPKATIDECIDDAAAAVAWTFKHAREYNGSEKKIYLSGHSAGGYLIDMIGLDKSWLAKYNVNADDVAALLPFSGQVVTHYNIRKQQGIGPLQATIDKYAPLSFIRNDAPPVVVISGDRELELFGRYEEQAYFWRMLKLTGHKNVLLYEMQGFDHGEMPHPAFHILKEFIAGKIKLQ